MTGQKRIVTLGSCYVDINVAGYPFEKTGIPVEKELVGGAYTFAAGGSAVASCRQMAQLGALSPLFIGVTGDDAMAGTLRQLLEAEGVAAHLDRRPELQTNVSFNMTNQTGNHIMCVAGTANEHMDENVLSTLDMALQTADYLYLGGVFKLKALISQLPNIVSAARRESTKIVVDHNRIPAGTDDAHTQAVRNLVLAANIYFPSHDEFLELWQVESIEAGLALLKERAPNLLTIVKNGAGSVTYQSAEQSGSVQPPHVEKIGDVTSAGDMFNGAVLSALVDGKALQESIVFGCKIAAEKIAA